MVDRYNLFSSKKNIFLKLLTVDWNLVSLLIKSHTSLKSNDVKCLNIFYAITLGCILLSKKV